MGKSSRARRDARRREHPRTRPATPRADGTGVIDREEIRALVDAAIHRAVVSASLAAPRIEHLNEIGSAAESRDLDPAVVVVDEVLARIGVLWEHGWQPQDLVHVVRRRISAPAARWVGRAVLVEADRSGAAGRAPAAWVEQLDGLTDRHGAGGRADDLLPPGGLAEPPVWTAALVVLDLVRKLPSIQQLLPPPSRWGTGRWARPRSGRPSEPPSGQHGRTLTKIRALLAKAESTEYAAEAEAFTAKAQDLMTRHAIDEALVAAETGESVDVLGTRVLIHQPYAVDKAGLLDVIARANRTRAVWFELGSSATLVGVPTDVEQVEMLFTSLLVQATRAMNQAGQGPDHRGADRTSAFRKAFLFAFASRIGERLTESTEQAVATYGSDLVPVLERQAEAVDDEFDRLFPHVTTSSRRRQLDARGWEAGRRAADEAVLPAGVVEA